MVLQITFNHEHSVLHALMGVFDKIFIPDGLPDVTNATGGGKVAIVDGYSYLHISEGHSAITMHLVT